MSERSEPARISEVPLVAGVELGGTKCIAVLARGSTILARERWPTTTPTENLPLISATLRRWAGEAPVAAVGLASFGPLSLDDAAENFGRIVNTPKPGWSGADVRGAVADAFPGPVGFDTDVTGAALAEGRWGASLGCATHVYLTIGTGIGGGIVIDGRPVRGAMHPELGHVRVRRHGSPEFAGICPIHHDCLEGLASGPALTARAGAPIDRLAADHPLWDEVATELAELMVMLILTLAPHRIVIGGGVAERRPMLFPRIHVATAAMLNDYPVEQPGHMVQRLIVPPRLGADAGPLGAVALGLDALAATAS